MAIETVTSENLAAFNAARMGPPIDPFKAAENEAVALEVKAEKSKEAKAAKEAEATQAREAAEAEIDGEEGEETGQKTEEPKKKGKLVTRFSELTTKARAAEERAAAAEARLAELEGKKAKEAPAVDKPAPDPKNYTDFDDYTDAVADWKADKKLAEREANEKKAKEEAAAGEVVKAWNTRIESAKERHADFHEIISSSPLEYEPVVRKILMESEYGPDVLYHLSNDDADAAKFSKMGVDQRVKFIGRLEGRIEAEFEAGKDDIEESEAPAKKLEIVKLKPKAPEPTKPIKATAATNNHTDSDGEFRGSFAQYEALRKAGKI
jgi:hypothetical protein